MIYAVCTLCGSRTRVPKKVENPVSLCCIAPVEWEERCSDNHPGKDCGGRCLAPIPEELRE